MTDRTRRTIGLLIRILVATVLLAWVFSQVDLGQFWRTMKATRWHFLVGVWTLNVVFSLVQSYALQIILRRQECRVGLDRLFAVTCVTALYSLVLFGIVSTGVKWYMLRQSTGKGTNVLSSMLYNQVTLSIVMTVVGLVGLILVNPTQALLPDAPQWVLPAVCVAAIAVIVLLSVLAVDRRTGGAVIRLFNAALRFMPRLIRGKGQEILSQIAVFQSAGWRFHLTIALLNAVDGLAVGLLMYLFAAKAAHVVVPVGMLIWLCAIVFVLSKIPVSVANLGVREVTLIGMLGLYGVDKSAAILMSVVLFSGLVFLALLGVGYQLYWSVAKR
jgi:uncharacterized membrane protein YbhN (UPF0104 family)